jgi:hypothetical protein
MLGQFEFKTTILTKKMPKYSKSVTQGRGHSIRIKNQIKRKDGNNYVYKTISSPI